MHFFIFLFNSSRLLTSGWFWVPIGIVGLVKEYMLANHGSYLPPPLSSWSSMVRVPRRVRFSFSLGFLLTRHSPDKTYCPTFSRHFTFRHGYYVNYGQASTADNYYSGT